MANQDNKMIDCDRCGFIMQVSGEGPDRVRYYGKYENGILCPSCVKIRSFDDENPILYELPENFTN